MKTKKTVDDKFVIKKDHKGLGVYAARNFKKGEFIHKLDGNIYTPRALYDHVNNFKRGIADPLQVGDDNYIRLDKLSVTFNHSCEPTTGVRDRSSLYALRDIGKGEELTYDYSTTIDECFWCQCGSPKCRGVIYDFFAIPNPDKKYYFSNNALPDHILKKYKKLLKAKCPCRSGKKYINCHGRYYLTTVK